MTQRRKLEFNKTIIPVIVINDISTAVPLAAALRDAGLTAIEITFRTASAPQAIADIKAQFEDMIIGAGTITRADQLKVALQAGSDFIVSPGMTRDLYSAFDSIDLPICPGIGTPSEAIWAMEHGYQQLKFFPAHSLGGVDTLSAMSGPIAAASFMPTGGITAETAKNYLTLPNVFAVGGSWMINKKAINAGDWDGVSAYAHASCSPPSIASPTEAAP